jgi:hypothetical protein
VPKADPPNFRLKAVLRQESPPEHQPACRLWSRLQTIFARVPAFPVRRSPGHSPAAKAEAGSSSRALVRVFVSAPSICRRRKASAELPPKGGTPTALPAIAPTCLPTLDKASDGPRQSTGFPCPPKPWTQSRCEGGRPPAYPHSAIASPWAYVFLVRPVRRSVYYGCQSRESTMVPIGPGSSR